MCTGRDAPSIGADTFFLFKPSRAAELFALAIYRACAVICLSRRTLQRWQRDRSCGDQRPSRIQAPKNGLSKLERERLLVKNTFTDGVRLFQPTSFMQ
jgi:hypothetical protein